MDVKSTLARGLQSCVGNRWMGDDFSDFTIVVEDTSFSCHRFILSACSGFFEGMFRTQMKEFREGLAKLDRMSKETFEIIINSIYKGKDGLTENTVLDVWSAAHLLQIDYLIEECKQFVILSMSVDNCFRSLNHAMMYSAQEVIDSCLVIISKNFEQVRSAEGFLQLPLDYFYKVIGSDILATSSEDSVVDAILTWMEYKPGPEHCSWLYSGALDENTASGISTHSVAIKGTKENRDDDQGNDNISQDNEKNDQETGNDDQDSDDDDIENETIDQTPAFVLRNEEYNSNSESCEERVEPKSHIMTPGSNKTMCNKNSAPQAYCKEADRKQHFLHLISACRLFLAKPKCLENLLKNHIDVLISTGAYNLVLNAQMYTLSVNLRHDAWPEAAVHRASSSYKHVMVFLSGNQFKAYNLDRGSVHKFSQVPEDCKISNKTIVFDNDLYFAYESKDGYIESSMITRQKSWASVTDLNIHNSQMLLAHDNYIYDVHHETYSNQFTLSRWSHAHGRSKWMTQTCPAKVTANPRYGRPFDAIDMEIQNIIRFQLYIIVFIKNISVVTAHCFNTETDNVHVCTTSMNAKSNSMTSFSSNKNVYVLDGSGSLWKVFSTDTTPVDFELVCNLWDFNYSLKGCVLYRKKLYIFLDTLNKENPKTLLTSLPGICEDIEMIQAKSSTHYLPMVLPGSWLTS